MAESEGAELCDPEALISPEQRQQQWERQQGERHDTVGCVALDGSGHLAAGVSTGGTGGNPPGRVGDSASTGSGFYADDMVGAVALTGDGEQIMRVVLAKTALDLLRGHGPDEAARQALKALERVGGEAGITTAPTCPRHDERGQGLSIQTGGRGRCPSISPRRKAAPNPGGEP